MTGERSFLVFRQFRRIKTQTGQKRRAQRKLVKFRGAGRFHRADEPSSVKPSSPRPSPPAAGGEGEDYWGAVTQGSARYARLPWAIIFCPSGAGDYRATKRDKNSGQFLLEK